MSFGFRHSIRAYAGTAIVATLLLVVSPAAAQLLVAEDFVYKQPTNIGEQFDASNKLDDADHGGGQNGIAVWQERWEGYGAGGIVSDDVTEGSVGANQFTAAVSNSASGGVGATLIRQYQPTQSLAGVNTLWFGADVLMNLDEANPDFRYVSFSPFTTGDPFTPSLGIGSRNDVFFASIGDTFVDGDFNVDADRTDDGEYHRIVGKVELNVGAVVADYNGNGVTDAADYTVYRDTFGSTSDLRADGDGSGTIDQADYDLWAASFSNPLDRLTVLIDPTDGDTSAGSTLVVEGQLFGSSFDESGDPDVLSAYITGNNPDIGAGFAVPAHSFVDNFAIGLTYDDVAAVEVPRLTAEVNAATGNVTLVNNSGSDIEVAYYEIASESGSINPDGWSSLEDQAEAGWAENSATAELLVESNLLGGSVVAGDGGVLDLGSVLSTGGTQDLVVRFGVLEGTEGLLNVATVVAASATAVPEPSAVTLLAVAALGFARKRG